MVKLKKILKALAGISWFVGFAALGYYPSMLNKTPGTLGRISAFFIGGAVCYAVALFLPGGRSEKKPPLWRRVCGCLLIYPGALVMGCGWALAGIVMVVGGIFFLSGRGRK